MLSIKIGLKRGVKLSKIPCRVHVSPLINFSSTSQRTVKPKVVNALEEIVPLKEMVKKTSRTNKLLSDKTIFTSKKQDTHTHHRIHLRPYQEECIEKCISALKKGFKRQVVSLPVGSGKTVVFSHLLSRVPTPETHPNATKTLVLAHREELLDQAWKAIKKANPELIIDIDRADVKATPSNADVVIASVPTLGRGESVRLLQYDPAMFKLIIVDEAHHCIAPSYVKVLDHFNARNADSHVMLWGCSATIMRADGIGLENVFEHISYHKDFLSMMREHWLCKLRAFTVFSNHDLNDVSVSEGDFSVLQLSRSVNNPSRNQTILASWQQYAAERKSTLIFAVNVQHVMDLVQVFKSAGVDARMVYAETPKDERAQIVEDFRHRKFPVLINCGVFTEGTDIPVIDCILLARPTLSSVLMHQMIGRGMRNYAEKKDCLVLDIVDNFSRYNLVTVPSLFGLHPLFHTDGAADMLQVYDNMQELIADNPEAADAKSLEEAKAIVLRKAEHVFDEQMLDLAAIAEKQQPLPEDVAKCTTMNWVFTEGRYILSLGHKFFAAELEITGVRENSKKKRNAQIGIKTGASSSLTNLPKSWLGESNPIIYVAKLGFKKGKASSKIAEDYDRVNLFRIVEAHMMEKYPLVADPLKKTAEWRLEPISEAQKEYIGNKWRQEVNDKLNRGETSFWIEKLLREERLNKKRQQLYYGSESPIKNITVNKIQDPALKDYVQFEWMQLNNPDVEMEHYFLPVRIPSDFCYLEVTQNLLGKFQARVIRRQKTHVTQQILTAEGGEIMEAAFGMSEQYVRMEYATQANFLKRGEWRQEIASANQIAYMRKLGIQISPASNLTKGQASTLIDQALQKQQLFKK